MERKSCCSGRGFVSTNVTTPASTTPKKGTVVSPKKEVADATPVAVNQRPSSAAEVKVEVAAVKNEAVPVKEEEPVRVKVGSGGGGCGTS